MATTDNTASGIRRVNAKSDFDFILRMACGCAKEGEEPVDIGWPEFDWKARFWTWSPANAYVVGCTGGVCTNCFNDDGRIHVVFNNHRLSPGELHCELSADIPASIYPDGLRREVLPQHTGIELVEGAGDCGCICEAEVELTLPVVYLTAYDLAVRNGYQGTLNEYVAYVNRFPSVVEASETVMRLLSDFDHGKALVADALTRQGSETSPSEPLASMAGKVLDLRLAVEGQPGIVDQSFGGRLPSYDLLNEMRNNQRADYPYCCAVMFPRVGRSVNLMGADAYLCSDGFFTEEQGVTHTLAYTGHDMSYVIFYFRNSGYTVPTHIQPMHSAFALNGHPLWNMPEGNNAVDVRSYSPDKGSYATSGLGIRTLAQGSVSLAGIEEIEVSGNGIGVFKGVVSLPDLTTVRKAAGASSARLFNKSSFYSLIADRLTHSEVQLVSENGDLAALTLPSLEESSGGIVENCPKLSCLSLPALKANKSGRVAYTCHAMETVELPELEENGGSEVIYYCNAVKALRLPRLRKTTAGALASRCDGIEVLDCPELVSMTGSSIMIANWCNALTSILLPELQEITSGVAANYCAALTELTLPRLERLAGDTAKVAANCAALTELNLPELKEVRRGAIATDCVKLTDIRLPKLKTVGKGNTEFYFLGSQKFLETELHLHMPEIEWIEAQVVNVDFVYEEAAVWLHLGSAQGGFFHTRCYPNTAGRRIFVTVEPGFRSELRIGNCTGMTADQLRDIIRNLGDNTDYMTLDIIFGAENLAKLTDEDIALATAKNYALS